MKSQLALLGGKKVRQKPFPYPPYAFIDKEAKKAVMKVLDKRYLSTFLSSPNSEYYWGKGFVKKLEGKFSSYYQAKYAVSTDSGTAALHTALAAAGVGFGDEAIVTPWSFSSSAKAPLFHNAIPVFADIEDNTFGLNPKSVEKAITKYTKAIIVVHLFGNPAKMKEIMKIAKKHKLVVIEDCAQAHGAEYKGRKVGTIGDIGIFSLNWTKQIAIGEGGMLITNNKKYAQRAQLIRNHGEVWGPVKKKKEMVGILGWGYLLNEMSSAIGLSQMKKLNQSLAKRTWIAEQLNKELVKFPFLKTPLVEKGSKHAYYAYVLKFNEKTAGISRDKFVEAVKAEGIPLGGGYVAPLYWNPVYKWKVFYGSSQFPYSHHPRKIEYKKGDCPVVERLHKKEAINSGWTHPSVAKKEINDIVKAFEKVTDNIEELKKYKKNG